MRKRKKTIGEPYVLNAAFSFAPAADIAIRHYPGDVDDLAEAYVDRAADWARQHVGRALTDGELGTIGHFGSSF